MFNKTLLSKVKVLAGVALCALAVLVAPALSLTTYASDGSDVSTCADAIEWVYKVMDGKMYKALYNFTTAEYVSDWIYVCDYPPEE